MNSDKIKQEISKYTEWAEGTNCYDIALFRILLVFEKYLIYKFISYSISGNPKSSVINNKIEFSDEEHLKHFLRGDRTYVEYLGKIENLSKHIFRNNPFTIILDDSQYSPIYNELKVIRNQISHDSEESRHKFFKNCLNSKLTDKYLNVNEYLIRRTSNKDSTSNYTRLVTGISKIVEFIDDPFF